MPKDGINSCTVTALDDRPSLPDRFIVQWWGGTPNRFYELASVRVDDAPDHHYRSDGGLPRKVEIRWAAVKDDPRLDQARALVNALEQAVALAERFEEDPDRYASIAVATLLTGGIYRPFGS
jgi:hypothetical protein